MLVMVVFSVMIMIIICWATNPKGVLELDPPPSAQRRVRIREANNGNEIGNGNGKGNINGQVNDNGNERDNDNDDGNTIKKTMLIMTMTITMLVITITITIAIAMIAIIVSSRTRKRNPGRLGDRRWKLRARAPRGPGRSPSSCNICTS